MSDPFESSGVRRTCLRCGSLTDSTARFCKKCGFGFTQASPAAPQHSAPVNGVASAPMPPYAAPLQGRSSGVTWAIVAALLAGLTIGGFLFYRIVATKPNAPAAKRNEAVTIPAVTSESTPSSVKPPPEADALTAKIPDTVPERASPPKHQKSSAPVPISSVDTPPVLITNVPNRSVATTTTAPAAPQPLTATPQTSAPRRPRAIQETEAESTPVPSSPLANEPAPPSGNATPANSVAAPEPTRKSNYDGPMAGMATWSGKLEKNGTLTITGGAASIGELAGAGLPGVPVHVTIDQTNLGFLEMPNAANGYRRLVLKSHAHHDKITIHWTVVQ